MDIMAEAKRQKRTLTKEAKKSRTGFELLARAVRNKRLQDRNRAGFLAVGLQSNISWLAVSCVVSGKLPFQVSLKPQ